jgi:hypothetical protein
MMGMEIAGTQLRPKRAVATFVFAYALITIAGTGLSLGIAAILHTPSTSEPLQNSAYVLSEPFLPFLNLLVWGWAAWLYFRNSSVAMRAESIALGVFWLAVALPLDFVAFVLIKTPISLSPYDFYIGQFPWIYLIYIAVLVSPLCYTTLSRRLEKLRNRY